MESITRHSSAKPRSAGDSRWSVRGGDRSDLCKMVVAPRKCPAEKTQKGSRSSLVSDAKRSRMVDRRLRKHRQDDGAMERCAASRLEAIENQAGHRFLGAG